MAIVDPTDAMRADWVQTDIEAVMSWPVQAVDHRPVVHASGFASTLVTR